MSYAVIRCYSTVKSLIKAFSVPILIRNLPRTLTEQDLETLFLPFGNVTSCDLVIDQLSGESKGFGFVEMENQAATDNAIAGLNAKKLENKKIRVKWSNQDEHQSRTAEHEAPLSGEATTHSHNSAGVKNAWDTARPKLTKEPGEYD